MGSEAIGWLLGLFLFIVPAALIIKRAGFSPWFVLFLFIPIVNLVVVWAFALAKWPIDEKTNQAEENKWSDSEKEEFKKLTANQK